MRLTKKQLERKVKVLEKNQKKFIDDYHFLVVKKTKICFGILKAVDILEKNKSNIDDFICQTRGFIKNNI